LTFDFHENELKISQFVTDGIPEIVQRMRPRQIVKLPRTGHFNNVPYQATHTCRGASKGTDPKTSALNGYLQSWMYTIYSSPAPRTFRRMPTTIRPTPSPR